MAKYRSLKVIYMNNFVLSLFLFFCFPIFGIAQITVSHTLSSSKTMIAPYDSTKNWLGNKNVPSYIGQTLYVKGMPKAKRMNGYDNFKRNKGDNSISGRWGSPARNNKFNTKYEDLVGKYFVVLDVQIDNEERDEFLSDLIGNNWWFKLQNRDNKDEVLWFYYDGHTEIKFPFITVSYYNYLKTSMVGKKYIMKYSVKNDTISTFINDIDFYTGDTFTQTKDDKWECTDITIEDKNYRVVSVLKNQNNHVGFMEIRYFSSDIITQQAFEEQYYNSLVKKYGVTNIDLVRQGKIKIGLPENLLILSWGEPEYINESSHGSDQWVYGTRYVYIKNGKITFWN